MQAGKSVQMPDIEPFDMWFSGPEALDGKQQVVARPSTAQMSGWLEQMRNLAFEALDAAGEADLLGTRHGRPWCARHNRTAGDAYTRTTMHMMAYIRQIWYLRARLGIGDDQRWPSQIYH